MTKLHWGRGPVRSAFSLLELLAVVTILGIIAVVVVPRMGVSVYSSKKSACRQYRGDLNAAIEKYIFEKTSPPADLSDLVDEGYYPSTIPNCPADNEAYTIDPETHRIAGHDH